MFVLGLTGSIGMGKSTTAQLFAECGVPVYDADATVHRLYASEAVEAIEQAFPGSTGEQGVDRTKLSAQVVGNRQAMRQLESIVHPMLRAHETEFLNAAEKSGAPVAVLDIPLLFETGADSRVDAVVVVSAPHSVQRERILARPGMTADKLEAIIARQMPDADKRARADFVVDTSAGLDSAREQIRHVLAKVATMPRRRS
ncbi:dephospho-CoA kinase [Afipia carboxidovorans OM5]|uniref:Dephospho-CoA kinase n=1 Tax=Afipia carboxidovorans (strain ATCC 49405 / DSM 1227 / KCTC 32145 / OM5) TaxID=504832 RepID=B6JAK8_AFIC5|nr:dephospho-CoA kinase [Afipia carboxidovorans]ACI91533.1 dephospho-CoA kinase [Afipia carboxidovorans OM5]AEI01302.1 dephospho-CoA kinase CoaE [Afipia carboxidovorans OM4]AEI04876.1 dephospho-CoA kinase CoaE [Afipia carboxidovorans OM5]